MAIQFGIFEAFPAMWDRDTGEAWVLFARTDWRKLQLAEVQQVAHEISEAGFHQRYPNLPRLPEDAFQVDGGPQLAATDAGVHLRDAIMPKEPTKPPTRLQMIWPAFVVGLGLVAILVWVLFLGWLIGHAVLAIL
jgi:hypothetical protein